MNKQSDALNNSSSSDWRGYSPDEESLVQLATERYQAGQYAECQSIVQQHPLCDQLPEFQHILALAHFKLGRVDAARDCLQRAITLNPQEIKYYLNAAQVERTEKQHEREAQWLLKLLEVAPDCLSAHYALGLCYQWLLQYERSEMHLRKAVHLDPGYGLAWFYLGKAITARAQSPLSTTESELRTGIPPEVERRFDDAVHCFGKALQLTEAATAECRFLHGLLSAKLGRHEDAIASLRMGLELEPNPTEWPIKLALALSLKELDRFDEAIAVYHALLDDPQHRVDALASLSAMAFKQGDEELAVHYARRALAMDPDHVLANSNLATALHSRGFTHEAEQAYRRAYRLAPSDHTVRHNLSLHLLIQGEFEEGWELYESRLPIYTSIPIDGRFWTGQDLHGKTVLVYGEQGIGDIVQFLRYIRVIKEIYGCRVLFSCAVRFHPLFSDVEGVDQLLPLGVRSDLADYWIPLLSIPYTLGRINRDWLQTDATFPKKPTKLRAAPELLDYWSAKLKPEPDRFRIGIAWQGSTLYPGDRHRSIPLRCFEPLSRLAVVELISLQQGFGMEQLQQWAGDKPVTILSRGPEHDQQAFLDTIAIMRQLDLIITCDTSIGHIAASLELPTWIFLPASADWRWMRDRSDSPWYPTVQLWRQSSMGDWDSLFKQAEPAVRQRIAAKRQPPSAATSGFAELMNQRLQTALKGAMGLKVLKESGPEEAEKFYTEELAKDPHNVSLLQAFALLKFDQADYQAAVGMFRQAAGLGVQSAWKNLGVCYAALGELDAAWHAYNMALKIEPESSAVRFNMAHTALLRGDYQRGWALYEDRLINNRLFGDQSDEIAERLTTIPKWQGESLDGKQLLLVLEQGFGDNIQFIRFVKNLKRHWQCRISVVGAGVAQPLLKQIAEIDQWYTSPADILAPDILAPDIQAPGIQAPAVWCPIMSLPLRLGLFHENSFVAEPYLQPEAARVARWQPELPANAGLKVGIYWQGSQTYRNDRHRSIPLEVFEQLMHVPDVQWICLQKVDDQDTAQRLNKMGITLLDQSQLDVDGAFLDTAAVIAQLDLVIGCDSAIGHLAAAMGREVWLALPHVPDWRWGLQGSSSTWYARTRLFRQSTAGDWTSLFKEIASELKGRAHSAGNTVTADAQLRQQQEQLARWIAAREYTQAIELANALHQEYPNDSNVLHLLGIAEFKLNCTHQAIEHMRRAIELQPNCEVYYANLGKMYQDCKDLSSAKANYGFALAKFPSDAKLWHGLGQTELQLDHLDEAAEYLTTAVRLSQTPGFGLCNDLAAALERRATRDSHPADYEQAMQWYQRALQQAPNDVGVLANVAGLHCRIGELQEARRIYARVLQLQPAHPVAQYNLAIPILTESNCTQGWQYYEARHLVHNIWSPQQAAPATADQSKVAPRWTGQDLSGHHLLLVAEQGLGDTIMFLRYADHLRQRYDCRLSLACQPQLVSWVQSQELFEQIVPLATDLSAIDYDYWEMLLSCPLRLGPPHRLPMTVHRKWDPMRHARIAALLQSERRMKVGLAWRGSHLYSDTALRNIPAAALVPLVKESKARFFSLQRDGNHDLEELNLSKWVEPFPEQYDQDGAFTDTAAFIGNLDLVISCDTAIAHLAGSLGKPVWLGLCAQADWRWGLEPELTQWYPTMKLFRQPIMNDWATVVQRMSIRLNQYIDQHFSY